MSNLLFNITMSIESFETLGKIAGIAGLSIGFLLIIFREIIGKKIFPTLTKEHSYKILKLIIILSFLFGIFGIAIWSQKDKEPPAKLEVTPIKELQEKVNSFNLNPSDPKVKLRFRSNKLKINFSFYASTTTTLGYLKSSIIQHFDLENNLKINWENDYYPNAIVSRDYITIINDNKYYNFDDRKKLSEIEIKDNDLIILNIIWKKYIEQQQFASNGNDLQTLENVEAIDNLQQMTNTSKKISFYRKKQNKIQIDYYEVDL
jgi:hypothetical protein